MPPQPFDFWQRQLLQTMRLDYPEVFGDTSPEGVIQPSEIDWTVYRAYYDQGLSPVEAVERAIAESMAPRKK
jgi:hypothetical protein